MVNKIIKTSQNILNYRNKSILSAAVLIAASYLASGFFGLISDRLLISRFFGGLESHLDVYFAAFVIPDTLFQLLVVGAISASFIPIYQHYLKKDKDEADYLSRVCLTSVGILFSLLTLLVFIFARPLAGLISHFPSDQLDLMANLIRFMSLAQLFFTLSSFLTAMLQSHRRFLIPALAPIFYNIGTIIGIYFFSASIGIYSAALGVVIGSLLHVLIQLPFAFSLGFSLKPAFDFRHSGLRKLLKLMPPRTLSLGLVQIERWITVNFSSILTAGSLSLFNFSRQIYILPINLFGVSLGQASFPSLSDSADDKNLDNFKKTIVKSTMQIFFFSLPASVLILVLRIPIIRLIYGAKNFPWSDTLLAGKAIAILSLSIAPQATAQLLTRAFHARQDTKTPLYISTFSLIIFALLSYIFTIDFQWGILGLASALTISNTVDFAALYFVLYRSVGNLHLSIPLLKMLFVSALTGIFLWLPMRLLDQFVFDTTKVIPLILLTGIVSIVGLTVYLLFSFLLHIDELKDVLGLLKKMGNWHQVLSDTDEVIEPSVSDQQ